MSCLDGYCGQVLLLVGEWAGRTFGEYREGLPTTGQSFSAAFQAAVEAEFELLRVVRLPTWPYFLDTLMVWTRRQGIDVD